jgi:muramidase (phage lysozyme)
MLSKKAILALVLLFLPVPQLAQTEAVSMLQAASFAPARGSLLRDQAPLIARSAPLISQGSALFEMGENRRSVEVWTKAPSLFAGQSGQSFFAPYPERSRARGMSAGDATGVARIRQIIGEAESRHHGYDAVQHGARIKPQKDPTDMTLAEIFAWIDATPGQPHAIGRYQFIPTTLRWLVVRLGVRESVVFTPKLQDDLADLLLQDAGIHAFRSGQMPRHDFMHNLAKTWAGLPTSEGVSYYDGYAGNSASMSWEDFDAQMALVTVN